jgi:hypothetical protein
MFPASPRLGGGRSREISHRHRRKIYSECPFDHLTATQEGIDALAYPLILSPVEGIASVGQKTTQCVNGSRTGRYGARWTNCAADFATDGAGMLRR